MALYSKTVTLLASGGTLSFESLRGKVILVTNVASQWGATKRNYRQLVELYDKYHYSGLEIFGFPSREFGGQEFKDENDVRNFVTEEFQVKFPITSITEVNGSNTNPVWALLKQKSGNDKDVRWNFTTKFIVSRDGESVTRYDGKNPFDLEADIVTELERQIKL